MTLFMIKEGEVLEITNLRNGLNLTEFLTKDEKYLDTFEDQRKCPVA